MSDETETLFALLRKFDTPTVCNALEEAMGGRSATGFTRQSVICPFPQLPPMVGFARTATIRATRPTRLTSEAYATLRRDYYRYIASGRGPSVVVVEDLDGEATLGAFWGEVNSSIHSRLGLKGVVTNGCVRDIDMLCAEMPIIAGRITPSHAFVHIEAFDLPVTVFGLEVAPNAIIHADRHGAAVIPAHYLADLPDCIDRVLRREKVVLDACAREDFDITMLEAAMQAMAELH